LNLKLPFDNAGVMFRSGSDVKVLSNVGNFAVAVNAILTVIDKL
jgi:hypothetical protein